MFNKQTLRKILHLIKVFSANSRRYRLLVRSWKDFKSIPISVRKDLKVFVDDGLIHDAFNITATSGSTSSRMLIAHSKEAYEAHLRRLVKLYRLAGIKKGMMCLNLCSYELNSGGRMMESAFKAAGAGVIPLGPISTPEKIQEAVRLVELLKPNFVNAYTNQLFDLFSVLGRKHSIRRCLVNGEPLWPEYRKRMETMGGVEILDHYGAMEISGLAVALKPDDEYMRVVPDGLLLEVLQDSGEVAATGTGALVVTDLNNTCMPLIRYRLGDKVELVRRRGALGIKILSRTEDSLLINGVVVQRMDLIRTVNDLLGHPRFFMIIDKHKIHYRDRLLLNIADGDPRLFPDLITKVVQKLGVDRCLEVRDYRGIIPRTINGKIKYFIDARKETA